MWHNRTLTDIAATRVLRVITRLNIGGPARQALLLTRTLAGEFPTTLVSGIPAPDEGELSDPRVPVSPLPLVRKISPRNDFRSFVGLKRAIDELGVGIVHSHMAKAGTLARSAALASKTRPITVHTFHGHVLDGYFSGAIEKAFVGMERALARRTDALVAVSEEVRDSLLALGIGDPERFHVIPLGFELTDLLASHRTGRFRKSIGVAEDDFLVGVLGRLVPIKRHDMLIRAVHALPDAHLVILGDGPEAPRLRELVARLGIRDRVHLVGWRKEIEEVLPDLDVVALTSRNEGSPVSLIEAHAVGIPSVATDVGGVRSVIEHGVTGFLAAPDDEGQVTHRLLELMEDAALRARMGQAARERARVKYSSQRLTGDIRDLYRMLMTRRRDSLT